MNYWLGHLDPDSDNLDTGLGNIWLTAKYVHDGPESAWASDSRVPPGNSRYIKCKPRADRTPERIPEAARPSIGRATPS
jgi:hypothetical protein